MRICAGVVAESNVRYCLRGDGDPQLLTRPQRGNSPRDSQPPFSAPETFIAHDEGYHVMMDQLLAELAIWLIRFITAKNRFRQISPVKSYLQNEPRYD